MTTPYYRVEIEQANIAWILENRLGSAFLFPASSIFPHRHLSLLTFYMKYHILFSLQNVYMRHLLEPYFGNAVAYTVSLRSVFSLRKRLDLD